MSDNKILSTPIAAMQAAETAGITSPKIPKMLTIDIVRPSLLDQETCERYVFHVRVNHLVYRTTNLVSQVMVTMFDLGLTGDEVKDLVSSVSTKLELEKLERFFHELDNDSRKAGK